MTSLAYEIQEINKLGYCVAGGNFGCACPKCTLLINEKLKELLNNLTKDKE